MASKMLVFVTISGDKFGLICYVLIYIDVSGKKKSMLAEVNYKLSSGSRKHTGLLYRRNY